jgi:hypothetical protein
MTSTVKVTSHNFPVLIETHDKVYDRDANKLSDNYTITDQKIVRPADGEQTLHCTTSRKLVITDLEYDDPRAAVKQPYAHSTAPHVEE